LTRDGTKQEQANQRSAVEEDQAAAAASEAVGILFVLRTGIAWEDLPQELGFGSGMTVLA
jgi:transposase